MTVSNVRAAAQQRIVVLGRELDAERREHDPVAVAVVEERRGLVVERVRVAEDPPRERIGALCDRVVAADHPELAVGGAGKTSRPSTVSAPADTRPRMPSSRSQ